MGVICGRARFLLTWTCGFRNLLSHNHGKVLKICSTAIYFVWVKGFPPSKGRWLHNRVSKVEAQHSVPSVI